MTLTRRYLRNEFPVFSRIPTESWRERALCAAHPTLPVWTWDDAVHGETEGQRAVRVGSAVAACATCPVAGPCAEDIDPASDEGVRAGTDLRPLRRPGRRAAS